MNVYCRFAIYEALGFWHFAVDDVMRAILHVYSRALSRSQFLFDFLKIWNLGRISSPRVCYLKSAKSVGNFRFYKEPRVRMRTTTRRSWHLKVKSSSPTWSAFSDLFLSYLSHSDLLVTNLIIFFSIKDVTFDLVGKISKQDVIMHIYLLKFFLFKVDKILR